MTTMHPTAPAKALPWLQATMNALRALLARRSHPPRDAGVPRNRVPFFERGIVVDAASLWEAAPRRGSARTGA